MKKAGFYVLGILLTVCMLFSAVACDIEEEEETGKNTYAVTLSATELTLDRYQTGELTASVTENGEPIAEYFRSDGIHMTAAGYAVWSAIINEVVFGK